MSTTQVNQESIAATYPLIRPYIRRTPIVEANGADFGLDSINLIFKLELLQHSGSFKARGAFTNLLTRTIPVAGVVAASGGNHGAAVAFAAMKLGKPARIFVASVASPRAWLPIRLCSRCRPRESSCSTMPGMRCLWMTRRVLMRCWRISCSIFRRSNANTRQTENRHGVEWMRWDV